MAVAMTTSKRKRPAVVERKAGLIVNKDHYIILLRENETLRRQVSILNQELALLRTAYDRDVHGKVNTSERLLEELAQ